LIENCLDPLCRPDRLLETLGHTVESAGPRGLFDDAFIEHTFVSTAREFE